MLPRCLKTETRKRASSPKAKPKSRSAHLLQLLLAALGRDALHQRRGVVRLQHLGLELRMRPSKTKHRRLADSDVKIAGALLDHGLQQLVDQNGFRHFASSSLARRRDCRCGKGNRRSDADRLDAPIAIQATLYPKGRCSPVVDLESGDPNDQLIIRPSACKRQAARRPVCRSLCTAKRRPDSLGAQGRARVFAVVVPR